jgi:Mg2+-importing ATPase
VRSGVDRSTSTGTDPYWAAPVEAVLGRLGVGTDGLTAGDAATRLEAAGPNRLNVSRRQGVWHELRRQFTEPIVVVLIAATALSLVLGDTVDASIILAIIVLSALLGFWQEHGAATTVARLLAQVQVLVEVRRDGRTVSVPPDQVVPGDLMMVNAGDLVPCDCRVVTAESLQVDEAALTGETYPRHKRPEPVPAQAALGDRHSSLLQGSHVVSGQGTAVAVVTGEHTELGRMSRSLATSAPRTSFEQGITGFGLMLVRVTAVLTAAILVINVVLGRPVIDAVLFSLALAVGVTPQMLPAIVTVSLSTGARRMARARVIVRRLDAIEDLGSMEVLFTDKTGTLTTGSLSLSAVLDADGRDSDLVVALAAANAGFQTGFTNPLDEAVLARCSPDPSWTVAGELPFDFDRKRLSVAVDTGTARVLVTKGAVDRVLEVCSTASTAGGSVPVETARQQLEDRFGELAARGYRVLGIARREIPASAGLTPDAEQGMEFVGFLVFEDPPKPGVDRTLQGLAERGVRVCMLTGDNRLAARHVVTSVGLPGHDVLTGTDVDAMDEAALARAVGTASAFAELSPVHKERIIQAARQGGAIVGYLGDGINDAGALHLADVGISVDTAVDVAKSAAAIVLLDKELSVVVDAVLLGRRTFANTLKYVYTTISANFGNIASMAAASAFLPFLPLLPRQILLLNFLSDLPSVTIADDRVDPEHLERPQRWQLHQVARFMVVFGLLSSAFDLLTFALLLQVFDAGATLFQSAWFVGSTLTEIAVLLVLRTRRIALRSRPGTGLLLTSMAAGAGVVLLPYVALVADPLGLQALPARVLLTLLGITAAYVAAAEVTKRRFYRSATTAAPAPEEGARQRRIHRLAREHGAR